MTNIHDCLNRAIEGGELDRPQGRAAQGQFAQLVARYETAYPRHQAQAMAAADLKEATRRAARSRYHAVVNQLQTARRLHAQIMAAPDPAVALRNLIERSDGAGTTAEGVRFLAEAYVEQANAMIAGALKRHSLDLAGRVRDNAGFRNMVLEAFGRDTGDAEAKALAEALGRAQEFLRQAFNAHGGDIGRLDFYGLPTSHDAGRIRQAGFEAWRGRVEELLDWSRIDDLSTGRPFARAAGEVPPRAATERFLRDVYDGLVTRGWDDRDPRMTAGGQALYNQRAEHRVLHFTPEGWLAYAHEFGGADPFSAMINGLHGLARDVAEMRVLGPNPRAGLEFAVQTAEKRAAMLAGAGDPRGAKLEGRVRSTAALARAMLAEQDGSASVPVNAGWARFMSGTRAVIVSQKLGSAILSSVTDAATISSAARVVGLNGRNVLSRSMQLVASHATRETAASMGYVASALADAGASYSRFMGSSMASGLPQRLANFTLRASGLTFLTDMHRLAFKMEFSGLLAGNAARGWADIDAPVRRLFEDRGIAPADWDALRAVVFRPEEGGAFITPFHWLEHQTAMPRAEAEGLAMRLSMLIQEQVEFAVPSASLEGRARWSGGAPGTFGGELLRSGLMFKSFALSLMFNQYRRIAALPTGVDKFKYAAGLLAPLIVLGAVAVQLKEMAKGRDPRPMDSRAFWLAALLQSGGLGIFGDFFAAAQNRFGGGPAGTIAGPVVGLGSDILGPFANGDAFANPGRAVANFVRYNTPVASSLWQTRLVFDRLVADQLQAFLDPEAELAWRRQEKARERDYATRTWWGRGELAPSRAVDLSNAAGGAR
jgi:hypothetical protein